MEKTCLKQITFWARKYCDYQMSNGQRNLLLYTFTACTRGKKHLSSIEQDLFGNFAN